MAMPWEAILAGGVPTLAFVLVAYLLYTAITRAKRLVVLVGSRKALAIAVRTAGTGRRHTALTHRLQSPGTTRP